MTWAGILPHCFWTSARSHPNPSDMVRILLEAGADHQKGPSGQHALTRAADLGDDTAILALLNGGVDANDNDGDALQHALAKGFLNSALILSSRGADVEHQGGPYGSPISAAAFSGAAALRFSVEQLMIDYRLCDEEGRNVLHLAAGRDDVETLRFLLDAGLDIEQEDSKGWSAIHYAALAATPRNLHFLLSSKAVKPRARPHGWSPLHLACRRNTPESIEMLLQAGYRPTTIETSTPRGRWNLYDIAYTYGNRNLIGEDGTAKHPLLEASIHENRQIRPPYASPMHCLEWLCDGCTAPPLVRRLSSQPSDVRLLTLEQDIVLQCPCQQRTIPLQCLSRL